MNSKQLFKDVLAGRESTGVPAVPLVYTFAANLRGFAVGDMLRDPTLLANSLQDALELLDYDVVVTSFDLSLEAEACGCAITWNDNSPPEVTGHPLQEGMSIDQLSIGDMEARGRIPIAIEVTRRLEAVVGRDRGMMAVVTGPLTLFTQLKGSGISLVDDPEDTDRVLDFAGTVATRMVQVYGELGLDAIAVAEDVDQQDYSSGLDKALPVYRSLWDILGYFESHSVFMPRGCAPESLIEVITDIGSDCVVLEIGPDMSEVIEQAHDAGVVIGCGISNDRLLTSPEEVADGVKRCLGTCSGMGSFLTTGWEVPFGTPVENLHAFMASARG